MSKRGQRSGREPLRGLFFDKLMRYALEPVMVADTKGRVVFANKEFLDLFGLKLKDTSGKQWSDVLVSPPERAEARSIFGRLKKHRNLSFFETPAVYRGKRSRKHLCWVAIPFRKGRIGFFLFVGGEKDGKGQCRVKLHPSDPRRLTVAQRNVIDMLVDAVWASEPETAKHSARVMRFAVDLAKKIGMNGKKIARLKIASLLHDLGKLGVEEKILFKKGKLTKKEFNEIKKHPDWGSDAVRHIYFLHDIIPIMADHHESYDGSGYPRGIKGKNIPLEARVLSVADTYEALTADRPYRKGFSKEEAIEIMEIEKGRKLDPQVTDIFLSMIKKKRAKWKRT